MLDIDFSFEVGIDLETISEYTFDYFGQKKWLEYRSILFENIQLLRESPQIGHFRKDIPENCLAWPVKNHVLIYTIDKNCVYLLRILHEKMDFHTQFI